MPIHSTTVHSSRRGNALVLAASVLVLLVIISTTFVSRTQTGRATAAAVRKEAERQDSVDGVGEDIAQLIANALFVRPVDARYDNAGAQGLVNPLPGESLEVEDDGLPFRYSLSSSFPLPGQPSSVPTEFNQFEFEALFPAIHSATSSNRARLDPTKVARDSALTDRFAGFNLDQRYGVDPWFPGNFAPFEVIPFTNWPDGLAYPWSPSSPYGVIGLGDNGLIFGDGTPSTFNSAYAITTQRLFTEGNPAYGPGFGDTRWLRDLEPMPVDKNNDGLLDSFLQWRHLTNISTPENGWRVVLDIADVFGAKQLDNVDTTFPNLIDDLSVPVEQWVDSLDYRFLFDPANVNNLSGYTTGITGAAALLPNTFNRQEFEAQWTRWSAPSPFTAVDRGLYFAPPANLIDLNDLDADGVKNEPGERPIDRFVGLRQISNPNGQGTIFIPDDPNQPDGSIAWNISRYLDDSDGDGWTDSFWFLAPGVRDGVRNVVSVSITDNGGRLDLSTATRYSPGFVSQPESLFDASNQMAQTGTTGFTPADLALVSGFNQNSESARGNRVENPEARVGFFDAPIHREGAAPAPVPIDPNNTNPPPAFEPLPTFDPARFPDADLFNDAAQDFDTRLNSGPILTWLDERGWFQATSNNVDPTQAFLSAQERLDSLVSGDSPPWSRFDLSSELELRANESLNTGDVFTRVEKIAGSWRDSDTDQGSPLRGHLFAQETTPFLNGLTTYEWKADLRHRSTVVSNTRNDLLPASLRWRWRPDTEIFANADTPGFGQPNLFASADGASAIELWQIPGLWTSNVTLDPTSKLSPLYTWHTTQRTWVSRAGTPYFPQGLDQAIPLSLASDFTEQFISQQSSRVDLREPNPWLLDFWTDDTGLNEEFPSGRLMLAKRLPFAIFHALTDGDIYGTLQFDNLGNPFSVFGRSYFGSIQNPYLNTTTFPESPEGRSAANTHWVKQASAGLAANILSYRDNDWLQLASLENSGVTDPEVVVPRFIDIAPLYDQYLFPQADLDPIDVPAPVSQQEGAVPLPRWGVEGTELDGVESENLAMLGLERQPFLVEAFIGNLYATRELDGEFLTGIGENSSIKPLNPFYQEGMRYLDGACNRTTVVAVQIANPFDKPIPPEELAKYRISVSGRHFPLRYARPDDVTRPTFAELDDVRLPLEPATENRPSSAIFFMCAPDWDNAWEDQISGDTGDDTTDLDTLFKERMIDWLDLACEQDLGVLDSNGNGSPNIQSFFDLDHPPAIPDRWGRTGTIRYRVPTLQEWDPANPYGDDTYGWSPDPAYYQRWLAQGSGQTAPNRDQYDQSRPAGLPPLEIEEGERIVELSRIDHDASIRAGQVALQPVVFDTDGDGLVDENLLNHPAAVWVVVDRFDSRELPLPIDEPTRKPGDFPLVPSHANVDLVTQAASGNLPLETAMAPLSMWGSMFGVASAVLPMDLGPGALPQLPRLTMPWPPLDGNRLIDIPVGNPQAQFSWIPGIFFPTNSPDFDTLVSFASARRAWGWDNDFNPSDPRTWGVQSSEAHPRFTSALQLTVDNSQGFLGGRYFPDIEQASPQFTNGYQTQVAMQGIRLGGDPASEDPCTDLTSSPDGCLNTVDGGQYEWCALRQFDPRDFSIIVPNANNEYFSKPTRFSGNRNRWKRLIANGAPDLPFWSDKSFYHTPQPFQLVHKDDDFQQIGEVLNIPLVGHLVDFDPFRPGQSNGTLPAYEGTIRTFSEFLAPQDPYDPNGLNQLGHEPVESTVDRLLLGTKARARIGLGRVTGAADFNPPDPLNSALSLPATSFADTNHSVPSLPAGERLLDLFIVDGPGFNHGFDQWAYFDTQSWVFNEDAEPLEPGLSNVVPGLVNINTAPVEVMRSIPGWYRTLEPSAYGDPSVLPFSNRTWFAEAVRSWRDRSQASDVPRGNGAATFPSPANFAFEQAYSYPEIVGGNQFAPSFDIRIEDLGSSRFNLIPDPALADDARPLGFTLANAPIPAPVRRSRGFAGIGSLRSVDLSAGLLGVNDSATPVNEYANAWPADIARQESSRNAQAASAFTLGSYRRNRQPLAPFRSLQDRDQSGIPLIGGQTLDPLGNQPGVGPLGRTLPSADDQNLAEDPGFSLSVPYDVAANGTPEVFDTDDDGFGDRYVLNQDAVSGDMEDANLLVAAASNVVSTRSDTFTVHFRVRSFKQNPQTLVWDATDPEFIVGESRYVMIVDRSEVDRPGDEPRILMLSPVRN